MKETGKGGKPDHMLNAIEAIFKSSKNLFVTLMNVLLIFFLVGGASASLILVVKLYPEYNYLFSALLNVVSVIFNVALISALIMIIFGIAYAILCKTKKCKEVKD